MIFSLHNRFMKKWDTASQAPFLLFIFVSILACGLFGLYGTVSNVAYAQSPPVQASAPVATPAPKPAPVAKPAPKPVSIVPSPALVVASGVYVPTTAPIPVPVKASARQAPKVSQQKSPQKAVPVAKVSQNAQIPVSMTISTTINNLQSLTPPQIQSVNVPPQVQNLAVSPVPVVPVPPQTVSQSSLPRSAYGLTPCAPSLERNIYLNSVWENLVPRRQLYADPALKMQKSRTGRASMPKRKMGATKKVASIPNSAQAGTANTNSATSMNKNDKIKLDSGSNVLIQPGSNVTVWADDPVNNSSAGMPSNNVRKNVSMNAIGQQNNSRPNTPFVPSATPNPEIPTVQVPIPNTLPAANVSVEPNLGNL